MKKGIIPISPSHLIDTIIIFGMLLMGLIAIIVVDLIFAFPEIWVFYLCWVIFFSIILLVSCLSYRGSFVVKIKDNVVESGLLTKIFCRMSFKDVPYVSFLNSFNYGFDVFAKYIVLSNEPICQKNIALTFHTKKQIVIRVSSKNYTKIKTLLPQTISAHLPTSFKNFQDWVLKHEIHLLKQNDGEFLLRYQF